jgi:hypothetical protein
MKAEEKAKELIEKFAPIMQNENWRDRAIQCAIIAVEEIIEQFEYIETYMGQQDSTNFWKEVLIKLKSL